MDPLFVRCAGCDGEGRVYERIWVYERGCGYAHEDMADVGKCPLCDGFGSEEIEAEPITLDDLQ